MSTDFMARNREMIEQATNAMRNAHVAGDTRAARKIADRILVLQSEKNAANYSNNVDPRSDGVVSKVWNGMKQSMQDPYYDALNRTVGLSPEQKQNWQAGKDYVSTVGGASSVGNFIGGTIAPIAAAVATRGMSLLPRALAQGTVGAATTAGDFGDRLLGGAVGALGDGFGRAPVKALSRPIEGTDATRRLVDQGIYPTAGKAISGGSSWSNPVRAGVGALEDLSMSMPVLGSAITFGRNGAEREAVTAAQKLGGVPGITVQNAGTGNAATINRYFNQGYRDASENLVLDLNHGPLNDAINSSIMRNNVQPAGQADIAGFLRSNQGVLGDGVLMGKEAHDFMQAARQRGGSLRGSPDVYARDTGLAYGDIHRAIPDSIANNSYANSLTQPALDELARLNRSYRQTKPAMLAAESAVAGRNDGLFSAPQYSQAVARNAKSQGTSSIFREGNAPGQQLATDWSQVMGAKIPDSGSAARGIFNVGALGGSIYSDAVLPVAAVAAASTIMNTPVGRKYMVGGYPAQQYLYEALRARPNGWNPGFQTLAGGLGAGYAHYLNTSPQPQNQE
jgi:hypothetical protein